MKMNHNKKRNTAFLFESIIKELTKAAIQNDHKKKKAVVSIIKEFFKKGSALDKELVLYKEIYEAKKLTKNIAEKVLKEAKEEYKEIDVKEVFNEQTKMINKINKTAGSQLFNNFIPNYKTIASIYQIFNKSLPIRSRVLLEKNVINDMTHCGLENKSDNKINIATLKIFSKKFNEGYKDLLKEQRELLNHYVSSFEDNGLQLKVYINEELHRIKKDLNSHIEKSVDNKMVEDKFKEVLKMINGFKGQYITEEMLTKILKLQKLMTEI
jgi:hypothetical protein